MFCFLVPQTYGNFDPISLKEKYAEINPKKHFMPKQKKSPVWIEQTCGIKFLPYGRTERPPNSLKTQLE